MLSKCTCIVPCVSPASCHCVFGGVARDLPVICGSCGYEDIARWPLTAAGVPWRGLGLTCPHCRRSHFLTFAGLPAAVQARIAERPRLSSVSSSAAPSGAAPSGPVGQPVPESEQYSLADETAADLSTAG